MDNRFLYHRPSPAAIEAISTVRRACAQLAEAIETATPPSAERTLAVRKVEEASMWANKAIVLADPDSEVIRDPVDDLVAVDTADAESTS